MPNLQKVTITFNTHADNRDADTLLHVFIKNRSNTTATSDPATSFIANKLAFEKHDAIAWDINPYLARGEALGLGTEFEANSSHTFELTLRSAPIPLEEVVLPVVHIHILPNAAVSLLKGYDRWSFDYTVTFDFGNGQTLFATSNVDGVTGIILDQDNANYAGLGMESRFVPPPYRPVTDALLTGVVVRFATHNDNKEADTLVNLHIVNRLSATSSQDIAVATNLFGGQEFKDPSTTGLSFGPTGLPLASPAIRLDEIMLPVVYINIAPQDEDRWIFDYLVTYTFSNGQMFTSRTNGVVLDQDHRKHMGAYQGSSFPTMTPPGQPELNVRDHRTSQKRIAFSLLQKKVDELINQRTEPPIFQLLLHNTGTFGDLNKESYYDFQKLVAAPPAPGTISPPGFQEAVTYTSSPASLGRLDAGIYFHDLHSQKITVSVDRTGKYPLSVEVDFDCSRGGINDWQVTRLVLRVNLTLTVDPKYAVVDVLGWVPGITADQLDGPLVVSIDTDSPLGGIFQSRARKTIYEQLTSADPFDGKTLRDKLNATLTAVLVGGAADGVSPVRVQNVAIDGDSLVIDYTGPENAFMPAPPPDWPAGGQPSPHYDFSPSTLANIDHIVVLTMENRSFDQMLGYLSLPPEKGGLGRKDVDGLRGGEINLLRDGTVCPSFPFAPGDTIIAPDPSHSTAPMHRAINGGKMDGFAQAYAEEGGPTVAPRIMGYHTAVNVPVYDALARDFAIGHRWFASHPGPTFCNRFYELTGRLNIGPDGFWEYENSSPLRAVFTPTIFDYLTARQVSWRYFEHHYCFLRFFANHTFDADNIVSFDDPVYGFVNLARSGNLPSVSFIDPHFIELPPGAECDGPPADVQAGQRLVRQVVEAVITGPLWSKTLLIITYDENGGFYDHVAPPSAAQVTPDSLSTTGLRVPAFVVSPWVKGGTVFGHDGQPVGGVQGGQQVGADGGQVATLGPTGVSGTGPITPQPVVGVFGGVPGGPRPVVTLHDVPASGADPGTGGTGSGPIGVRPVVGILTPLHFDHTSILKTIARRFLSDNPPYMGARYAAAYDLSWVLGSEMLNNQFLPFISYQFAYGATAMRLDVQGAGLNPGTPLWQHNPNDTIAQEFSFEDAGGGYWYIRTHTGNLYVTADDSLGLKQDMKYTSNGTGAYHPDRQRWAFTPANPATVLDRNRFIISNASFPGKVLQPAGGSSASGALVVLGDPAAAPAGAGQSPYAWTVTSPQASGGSGQVVTTR